MFSSATPDSVSAYTWDGKKMMSFNYIYSDTLLRDTGLENVRDLESCMRDR